MVRSRGITFLAHLCPNLLLKLFLRHGILKLLSVFNFSLPFLRVELLEPAAKVAHNILRCDSRGRLKLPINSVLVYLFHRVDTLSFLNIESYNFDGILLLVHVVSSLVYFSEASLSNKVDVFELFLESTSIKDVVKRRLIRYFAEGPSCQRERYNLSA